MKVDDLFFGLKLKLGWHFCEVETPLKNPGSATVILWMNLLM